MRKNYVKPELFYESFVLSQHIAGCKLTLSNLDVNNCTATGTISDGFTSENVLWFAEANGSCIVKTEEYCYTNGTVSGANINS